MAPPLWRDDQTLPAEYDLRLGGTTRQLPVRLLDGFYISYVHESSRAVPMTEIKFPGRFIARGLAVPPPAAAALGLPNVPVQTAEVVDWCMDHGATPALWLITHTAWYKLLSPAPEYMSAYAPAMRRAELCTRASAVIRARPTAAYEELLPVVLAKPASVGNPKYTAQEVQADAEYILAHLTAWAKGRGAELVAGGGNADMSKAPAPAIPFLRALQQFKVNKDNEMEAALGVESMRGRRGRSSGGSRGGRGRGRAGDRLGVAAAAPSPTASPLRGAEPEAEMEVEEAGPDDGEEADEPEVEEDDLLSSEEEDSSESEAGASGVEGEEAAEAKAARAAARQPTPQQQEARARRAQLASLRERHLRDRQADRERGEPPAVCRSFRIDAELVPDVLMIWEMCQSFSVLFQLPPFSLAALEAAFVPGPLKLPPSSPKAPPPSPAAPQTAPSRTSPVAAVGTSAAVAAVPVVKPESDLAAAETEPTVKQEEPPAGDGVTPVQIDEAVKSEQADASKSGEAATVEGDEAGAVKRETAGAEESTATPAAPSSPPVKHEPTTDACGTAGDAAAQPDMAVATSAADATEAEIAASTPAPEEPMASVPSDANDVKAEEAEVPVKQEADDGSAAAPAPAAAAAAAPAAAAPDGNAGGATAAETEADRCPYDLSTLIDAAYLPSAVLLRDIHVCLLKVIEEVRPKKSDLNWQPENAKLVSDDPKGEQWQERSWQALQTACGNTERSRLISSEAKSALAVVQTKEFLHLTPRQRIGLLRSLMDLALASEVMRDHIQMRQDGVTPMRGKPPRGVVHNWGEGGAGTSGRIDPANGTDLWLDWLESCRCGLRKPIGYDYRKRRYWALGGRAGAWRLFVEQPENGGWGWYEGPFALAALTHWLERAGIEREAALLASLASMPKPRLPPPQQHQQPVQQQQLGVPTGVDGAALAAAAGAVSPAAEAAHVQRELDRLRPNGYRNVEAPLLRGECNVQHVAGRALSAAERIHACVEALLMEIDFWLPERPANWIQRTMLVLETCRAARSVIDVARCVLETEAMLQEAGVLAPEWPRHMHGPWRARLCSQQQPLDMRTLLGLLATLQGFVVEREHVLTRAALLKRGNDLKCALVIPACNDQVVLLRTGALLCLEQYAATAATCGQAAPELDVVRARVQQLNPVERFRVVSIAYRSYPQPPETAPAAPASVQGFSVNAAAAKDARTPPLDVGADERPGGLAEDGGAGSGDEGVAAFTEKRGGASGGAVAATAPQYDYSVPVSGGGTIRLKGSKNKGGAAAAAAAAVINVYKPWRPPAVWMVLQPIRAAVAPLLPGLIPAPQPPLGPPLVVPIFLDTSLPDYLVKMDVYERGCVRSWQMGDRFRMYFGGKLGQQVNGQWYKGTILSANLAGFDLSDERNYDPWESINVAWDQHDDGSGQTKVSPWEIEMDPDVVKRLAEERRRAEEAAARAARLANIKGGRGNEAYSLLADLPGVVLKDGAKRTRKATINYREMAGSGDESEEEAPKKKGKGKDKDGSDLELDDGSSSDSDSGDSHGRKKKQSLLDMQRAAAAGGGVTSGMPGMMGMMGMPNMALPGMMGMAGNSAAASAALSAMQLQQLQHLQRMGLTVRPGMTAQQLHTQMAQLLSNPNAMAVYRQQVGSMQTAPVRPGQYNQVTTQQNAALSAHRPGSMPLGRPGGAPTSVTSGLNLSQVTPQMAASFGVSQQQLAALQAQQAQRQQFQMQQQNQRQPQQQQQLTPQQQAQLQQQQQAQAAMKAQMAQLQTMHQQQIAGLQQEQQQALQQLRQRHEQMLQQQQQQQNVAPADLQQFVLQCNAQQTQTQHQQQLQLQNMQHQHQQMQAQYQQQLAQKLSSMANLGGATGQPVSGGGGAPLPAQTRSTSGAGGMHSGGGAAANDGSAPGGGGGGMTGTLGMDEAINQSNGGGGGMHSGGGGGMQASGMLQQQQHAMGMQGQGNEIRSSGGGDMQGSGASAPGGSQQQPGQGMYNPAAMQPGGGGMYNQGVPSSGGAGAMYGQAAGGGTMYGQGGAGSTQGVPNGSGGGAGGGMMPQGMGNAGAAQAMMQQQQQQQYQQQLLYQQQAQQQAQQQQAQQQLLQQQQAQLQQQQQAQQQQAQQQQQGQQFPQSDASHQMQGW